MDQKFETITTDDKLPFVDRGVLWHCDDLVAAWVCDRLNVEMPIVSFRAFGLVSPGTADGIHRDLTQIYMVGGVIWYDYCDGQGGAHHDITAAVAIDEQLGTRTPETLKTFLLDYPFGHLKVPRISVNINETNATALEQAQRMGFVVEGRKRRAGPHGSDMIMLGLLPEECPFWSRN